MLKQIIETTSILESILSTDILGAVDVSGLNKSSRRAILVIGKFEGLPMGKLQKRCSMTKGNFSIICDKLFKLGYIGRNYSNDDRRICHIYLTDAGTDLYRNYEQIVVQRYSDFYDKLTIEQQYNFEILINAVSKLFE